MLGCVLLVQAILEGQSNEVPFPFIVDVRNIAEAHIQAAVTPEAKGQRYLVSNADTVPGSAIIGVLKERFPGLKFKDAKHEERKPVLDNSKVRHMHMTVAHMCVVSRETISLHNQAVGSLVATLVLRDTSVQCCHAQGLW